MKQLLALLLAMLMATAFAGCVDDEPIDENEGEEAPPVEPTPPPTAALTVTYSGVYGAPAGTEYTAALTVEAGTNLTLTFENNDQNQFVSHDWYLEALDVRTAVIGAGESDSVTFIVDLEPGEYVYYCAVGDHRENGMEGTLTVTAPAGNGSAAS